MIQFARPIPVFVCALLFSAHAWAAWSPPVTISDPGVSAFSPRLAVDGKGNALALWKRYESVSSNRIQAASRPAGGIFGPAQMLSDPGIATDPVITFDGKGNALAAWARLDGTHYRIQVASRPAGGTFGAAETVTDTSQSRQGLQLAIDKKGNALAVWRASSGPSEHTEAAFRPVGGAFGPPQAISDPGQFALYAELSLDKKRNALAVWERSDGTNERVEAAFRPVGGTFEAAQAISDPQDVNRGNMVPHVAIDGKGNALVMWRQFDGTEYRVEAAYRPKGGPFAPAFTVSDPGENGGYARVAFDKKGNGLAVWERSDGANWLIQAALRPPGGAFGPADTISTPGADSVDPHVAIDKKGIALAMWQRSDGGFNYRIQSALRPAGGAYGAPETLSDPGEPAGDVHIAIDKKRNALAAWIRNDGSYYRIQAAVHTP